MQWGYLWLLLAATAAVGAFFNPWQAAAAAVCLVMHKLSRREDRDMDALP